MKSVLLFLLTCCAAQASSEKLALMKNIPDKIWNIQEEPEKGIMDAVVVKHVIKIGKDQINQYRMVRILTEAGKKAAEMVVVPHHLRAFRGRVTDRSGNVFDFNQDNMIDILLYKVTNYEQKSSIIIPPGLTDDCIVEISWSEKAEKGIPIGQFERNYDIAESFYCLEKSFEIVDLSKLSSYRWMDTPFEMVTRVVWPREVPEPIKYSHDLKKKFTLIEYKDIPPTVDSPFPGPDTQGGHPSVEIHQTIPYENQSINSYWEDFSKMWIKLYYDYPLDRSHEYHQWFNTIKAERPDGLDGLKYVLDAFYSRVSRNDFATTDMLLKLPEKISYEFNMGSLNDAFVYRVTDQTSMTLILHTVLKDFGYKTRLLFAPEDPNQNFDPKDLKPFSLNFFNPVFTIQMDKGKWFSFSPAGQQYKLGYIPPHFRGRDLLLIEPYNDWAFKFFKLPRQDWRMNRTKIRYNMELRPNGNLQFQSRHTVNGYFDGLMRENLLPLRQEEANQLMKHLWESGLADWTVGNVSVNNVRNPNNSVKISGNAAKKLNISDREWISIQPFPGSPPLLNEPSLWPKKRTQAINLKFNQGQICQSKIVIPKGWKLRGKPSWGKKNKVGQVKFQVKTNAEGALLVERSVIVENSQLSHLDEPDLKQFFTWLDNAMRQEIAIEKGTP